MIVAISNILCIYNHILQILVCNWRDFNQSTQISYCSFYDKILNSFKFPTIFPKECEHLFDSQREKIRSLVFLGALFPPWKPGREVPCSVFWRKCDGWSVTGYVIAQEASVTAKPLSWIHLSVLVDESLKVQLAEVQLFLHCSEQQNHFPQRKSFELLLLLKSVFKDNLLNTLFAWGLTKSADNHTGTDQ